MEITDNTQISKSGIDPSVSPRTTEPSVKDLNPPFISTADPNGIRKGGGIKKSRVGQAIRRKNIKKAIWVIGSIAVLVFLVAGGIFYSRWKNQNLPGEFVSDQGREHVGPGHGHIYNSNPPTSGPHFVRPAEWGLYKEELPDEVLIHNMEHGGVWISYKPEIAKDTIKNLESFYEKYGRKIIVAPRSKNDTDIALAAWNRLDKFSAAEYSDERIERFIRAFRNKGPEFVP